MSTSGRGRNSRQDSKWGAFLFGALAGGAIGAALALFYAPSEGTEFRKDVGEKFDEISDSINAILKNAKMSAEKMLNEGRGHAEDLLDTAYDSASDLVDDVDDTISNFRNSSGSASTGSGDNTNSTTGESSNL